jgi:glycosyltransferase involved in cell wall biosynthesis
MIKSVNRNTRPPPRTIIDFIIPLYNESDHIVKHVEELLIVISKTYYEPRLILVDDGSQDNTWDVIQALSERYIEIQGIRLSKNFGKDSAIFAGLKFISGEAVIIIDGDGQHPIKLIPSMLQAWENGAMIVNCIKENRHYETFGVRLRASFFNYIMSKLISSNQFGASDFKLLDKDIAKILSSHETSGAVFRYSVANLGFSTTSIFFDTIPANRPSRFKIMNLFQLAIRAIMFHTEIPLKSFIVLMLLIILMNTGLIINLLFNYIIGNIPAGYTTLLMVNIITLSLIILGFTGLAVYIKGTLDIVAKRSNIIIWQKTSIKKSLKL